LFGRKHDRQVEVVVEEVVLPTAPPESRYDGNGLRRALRVQAPPKPDRYVEHIADDDDAIPTFAGIEAVEAIRPMKWTTVLGSEGEQS
jgi:hypothetical protein